MKTLSRPFLGLMALSISIHLPILAQEKPGFVNVKDFGAKGDGGVDDTAAIQKAFDTGKPVYFPAGTYHITDAITMHAPWIRGDGMNLSVIAQSKKDKDIFFVKFAWRGGVSGLGFRGGAKQLNLRNLRVDQGLMIVEKCSFNDSTDFAVYMEDQSNPMLFTVRDCHFQNCAQALYTVCDWTTLSDCWITTAAMDNRAAIVNKSGKLHCQNLLGVPTVSGKNDRWIDNYGYVSCRNCRFGGESGGMTPVYNFARLAKSIIGPAVVLDDCHIAAQGSGRKCAVYLEEVPNLLAIRNCQLTVPAVSIAPRINLKDYFKHARPGMLQYDFQGNFGEYNEDAQAKALQSAAAQRDSSPEPIQGQLNPEKTRAALERIVARVKSLPAAPAAPAESNGHKQKNNPTDYREIAVKNAAWDLDDYMDATTVKNSDHLALAAAGDDMVFLHRTPNSGWPHALIRNVEIDLDRHPWLSWRQKDPGPDPLPADMIVRPADQKLFENMPMPMGYALKIIDNETKRMVLLAETHWPPWFNYGAADLRKLFDVKSGKRSFTIRYYPLGVLIRGQAGDGVALAGEYQILDFIRAEAE